MRSAIVTASADRRGSPAAFQIGPHGVMAAGEVKGDCPLPGFKYQPQIQPGSTFVEMPGQLADGEAAVKMRVSESVPHGVQGVQHHSVMPLGDAPAKPLRGFNLAAHSNCP